MYHDELTALLETHRGAAAAWFLQTVYETQQDHERSLFMLGQKRSGLMWGLALFFVETPVDRASLLHEARWYFEKQIGPIANVLLGLPRFADDRSLQALAMAMASSTRR
jgi:hypothetical protein